MKSTSLLVSAVMGVWLRSKRRPSSHSEARVWVAGWSFRIGDSRVPSLLLIGLLWLVVAVVVGLVLEREDSLRGGGS